MHKLSRKDALEAIKSAGTLGDQKAFLRLYTENRIALVTAKEAYASGQRFARFIADRDAAATT